MQCSIHSYTPSLSQQIVRFLLLDSNFSPFSVSFHYYNINISPRKYFPRILFPSRWYERLVTKHVTDGNIFSRKKGAIARRSRAAKETKPVPLSPEWFDCVEKRKIRADFPFLVFFQPGGRSTMLFRVSQHLSSSSNRDLWDAHSSEKGAIFVTRRDIAFYVHDTFPFRCFVVLLFCFDALCNRDEWFEIEDGFEIGVTRTVETTCMNLWDRMSVLFLHLSFTSRWELESTSLSQKFISVLSSPVK